jgi:hypothetical protein
MTNQTAQDIDLWEAWIEFDHVARKSFGTLYIIGEVLVNKKDSHPRIVKCVDENEPDILVLKIQTSLSSNLSRAEEVVYSESLHSMDQYSSIKIYRDSELLIHIEEVEIVI